MTPAALPCKAALLAAALACSGLAACGHSDSPPPLDPLKVQREDLDRARGVERTLQDAAQKRDAQIESDAQGRDSGAHEGKPPAGGAY